MKRDLGWSKCKQAMSQTNLLGFAALVLSILSVAIVIWVRAAN